MYSKLAPDTVRDLIQSLKDGSMRGLKVGNESFQFLAVDPNSYISYKRGSSVVIGYIANSSKKS